MLSSETKNQFKSRSMQKIPLPPWKLAEDGWMSPKYNRVFSFQSYSLLLKGPWCMSVSNIAAYPSETLIRSSGGPSTKKGVGNSIQITQALRSRGIQGRHNPFLFSPPPQVLAFDLPTSVTERCSYHSILFSGIWESKLWRKSSLWGGLSNLIKNHFIWQTPQGKPSCQHVLAPPGWVQVSRWIA